MTSTSANGKTSLTIRVQARGGKFLGDDIGGAQVTVRDDRTGQILVSGTTQGSSGTVVTDYAAGASLQTIVTPLSPPQPQWVVADSTTSAFVAEIDLDQPTPLRIEAVGPLGGLQSTLQAVATQWVSPGDKLKAEPGLVVELPGLLVQVQEPATHYALSAPGPVSLQANVTMMCGCPIAEGEPWIPSDFDVVARIHLAGKGIVDERPLVIDGQTPSLFTGFYEVKKNGYYEARISAVQKSTGNSGAGVVTFFLNE